MQAGILLRCLGNVSHKITNGQDHVTDVSLIEGFGGKSLMPGMVLQAGNESSCLVVYI